MLETGGTLEARIRGRLEELERNGLSRRLLPPTGIDLSSNDYLRFASHPALKERMAAAVMEEGCGSTGSRLLRGDRRCFSRIEQRFAAFKGTEAALYFGSGYAANLAVLSTFLEEGDVVFFDRLNHASLIDGMRMGKARRIIFPHNDLAAFQDYLNTIETDGQRFLVVESLFSMDGDIAPLQQYAALCKVFLSINPAGKALGAAGAFVAGAAWVIEYLIQRARTFIFSTAPPPSIAAALDAALDLLQESPEPRNRLHALTGFLRGALADRGWEVSRSGSQILPILIGDNRRALEVARALQRDGFDIRAIRPPTVPEGTARLRVSVNTGLNEAILSRFVESLNAALPLIAHQASSR